MQPGGEDPSNIVLCFTDGGGNPRGHARCMCSAKQRGCLSWESEPSILGQDALSRKDRGTENGLRGRWAVRLSMATQIPAPGLLLTESGPGVYTSTLATECSPPPHGAFKWSQTHSCREPGHLPLSD